MLFAIRAGTRAHSFLGDKKRCAINEWRGSRGASCPKGNSIRSLSQKFGLMKYLVIRGTARRDEPVRAPAPFVRYTIMLLKRFINVRRFPRTTVNLIGALCDIRD